MRPERDFKSKIYYIVKKIPKGKVLTYKKLAELTGRPRAWRAAGNILSKNKDSKIPCYRVVRTNGEIGGYNRGPKRKEYLLKKEGVIIRNRRIQKAFKSERNLKKE